MKTYAVTLPIAGHVFLEVEADSEERAIAKALKLASIEHLESWEVLERVFEGNVCYCPSPWEARAEESN